MVEIDQPITDQLAYDIWRFLSDYPKRKRNGITFQNDFASFLERVNNYSIIARFEDQVETATGIYYKPDLLVNVVNLRETFIVFECKRMRKVDINIVTAFCKKVQDLANKKEIVLIRRGKVPPIRYKFSKLYRVLISAYRPTEDALGFCWGYGIPVFFPAKLPDETPPVKVIKHRLGLFEPSNSSEKKAKEFYLTELSRLDKEMFCDVREKPKDYRKLLIEVRKIIYGVNTLINRRWIIK
jgi:hypothetical protein